MILKGLLCGLLAFGCTFVAALDFSQSNWIGKSNDHCELTDFRYDFNPLPGKTAATAEILIAADNNYTLWVNGECIGVGNNREQSQGYCVTLKPGCNLFAVEVENRASTSPAALIAAIQITYTDKTTETIKTDCTWRVNDATPGFQAPKYDDLTWPYAIILGAANQHRHTPCLPITPSALSLSDSFWIWTNETDGPGGNAPVGRRAFRKTIHLPGGILASGGTIILDVDDGHTLYINGKTIGSGHRWIHAKRWTFTFDSPTDCIVIAVDAYNDRGPAGIIAAVEFDVKNCYCSTYSIYVSDCSWKYSCTAPAGFEQIDYDDSSWRDAVEEGPYGMAPWGDVTIVNG
ncbi:hypothetical protein APHAL10511_004675 [Amanita phalloides]|nr:hypothetical protein APHAL10511_004675 [Amanita phalloides]